MIFDFSDDKLKPPLISSKAGIRRWNQESFKKFKEKEAPQVRSEKMENEVLSISCDDSVDKDMEKDDEVIYISSDSSESEEEEDSKKGEFEKTLKHDINFALAKYVVDKKISFDLDKDKKITGFKKKMIGAIRRGDILTLRMSLEGGQVHVPQHVLLSSSAEPPVPAAREAPSPVLLSNENSPEASFEWIVDEDVPQMPVISIEEKAPHRKFPSAADSKKEIEQVKSKVKIPLKPLNIFQSIKRTSFKIPRKTEGEERWMVNGALWRWALGVDDNGQNRR